MVVWMGGYLMGWIDDEAARYCLIDVRSEELLHVTEAGKCAGANHGDVAHVLDHANANSIRACSISGLPRAVACRHPESRRQKRLLIPLGLGSWQPARAGMVEGGQRMRPMRLESAPN